MNMVKEGSFLSSVRRANRGDLFQFDIDTNQPASTAILSVACRQSARKNFVAGFKTQADSIANLGLEVMGYPEIRDEESLVNWLGLSREDLAQANIAEKVNREQRAEIDRLEELAPSRMAIVEDPHCIDIRAVDRLRFKFLNIQIVYD